MKPLSQTWPQDRAERYRARGYWQGETFPALLRARAADHPDRTALVWRDQRITYLELNDQARRFGAGLLDLGLTPGDRVLVQLGNTPDFFRAAFGLFAAGLIPVYALPAHRRTEVEHLLTRSEARAMIIPDKADGFDYRGLADELAGAVPTLRHVIVAGEAGPTHHAMIGIAADPARLPADPDPQAVAFSQISGGSTGLSKLIPRTHDDYIYSLRESARICGLGPESVYMAVLPVAHNFTMSSPGTFGAFYAGATVVLCPSPVPDAAFPLIAKEGVTITALVPPLALLWLDAAQKMQPDLSSLQVLQVGGAKFLPESARRVRPVLGCTLQQVFGMAEGLVNYTRLDDDEEVIVTTQGRPISPDDEILVLDDDGQPVPDGVPGHLLTRGPYTISAYHDEPAANARSFEDGYYRTGDIVARQPSGHLVVQGRAGDHINRAGEKISAEEVEDHLLAHPDVFDAVVVSIPDAHLGERICAFVKPRDGAAPRPLDIRKFMRARQIAAFKIPDEIRLIDSFGTTAVGKISRRHLRQQLRTEVLADEAKSTSETETT
ncbi:2,3-dihydroxybenzoate-AMP ligase [Pseudooceanicola sediminis]|uniref:2,3-dihydroxybenzoate-AMP ligase n=1 Tax=Pseudooceanicola sediminis TaxID=2211117 RepID=A0A399J1T8_9RHOB|nr:AMP-binding protein [Pseudooceanicola sediminis]KAA2313704.1 AMP-binding protein [Puniceibacterium sp. HSS470]RII38459.1 2,3-dihydroxybenzoate-AMP ligase [Pseudooceanicola sediminis]|tara:strand:+ start:116724 stop:118373 length:1650 start_codon:yes stop_codon:yes gene_type:complete